MSTHIDYTQIAAKLDYAAVEKKLEQLAQRKRGQPIARCVFKPIMNHAMG
jgi:hypothetical protein